MSPGLYCRGLGGNCERSKVGNKTEAVLTIRTGPPAMPVENLHDDESNARGGVDKATETVRTPDRVSVPAALIVEQTPLPPLQDGRTKDIDSGKGVA